MVQEDMLVIRLPVEMRHKLEELAKESGVDLSKFTRAVIAIAVYKDAPKSQIEVVIERMKKNLEENLAE